MTNPALESLLTTIGPRLTCVCLGLIDAHKLAFYRDGTDAMPSDIQERLEVTRRFTETFVDSGNTPATAAAYMRGSWPDLNDDAPCMVIRNGGPKDWERLLKIAELVARDGGGY